MFYATKQWRHYEKEKKPSRSKLNYGIVNDINKVSEKGCTVNAKNCKCGGDCNILWCTVVWVNFCEQKETIWHMNPVEC